MTSPYYETLLGFRTLAQEGQAPLCSFVPADNALGRKGVMHGGAVTSLLEAAGFAAVRAALAEREAAGSPPMDWQLITTTVDFQRPGLEMETFAQARVEKMGGRSASLHVLAWNTDPAKPVATAEMTFLFLPRKG